MYTGIVQGAFPVTAIVEKPGLKSLTITLPEYLLEGLVVGASVAVDGVCLTVSAFNENRVDFDVMQETLTVTTLSDLIVGSIVNIERSAKQGAEVGGHNISGHVDGVVEVIAVEVPENNRIISYRVPERLIGYIFKKGFIGLNGCSLTVADVDKSAQVFSVALIPETLRVTNHGQKAVGDSVNVEIDRQTQVIVDTVKSFLQENLNDLANLK